MAGFAFYGRNGFPDSFAFQGGNMRTIEDDWLKETMQQLFKGLWTDLDRLTTNQTWTLRASELCRGYLQYILQVKGWSDERQVRAEEEHNKYTVN